MTGYGTVASAFGLPDAGLTTYTEMRERVERIAGGTAAALVADADTGFSGLLNVERTVRGYEAAERRRSRSRTRSSRRNAATRSGGR